MWTTPRQLYLVPPPTEESCSLAEFTRPTGCEPKLFDDLHHSQIAEMIFWEESGDKDTEPSYLSDAELDDETIGKALTSTLFNQERGDSADRRQACHSREESLLPAQSFFAHSRTGEEATTNVAKDAQNRKAEKPQLRKAAKEVVDENQRSTTPRPPQRQRT